MSAGRLSLACQIAAVLAAGTMAGFFFAYAANVVDALRGLDGPTYVAVQAALNRAVRHAVFFAAFVGPTAFAAASMVLGWRERARAWWWVTAAAAIVYALGVIAVTSRFNLPINAAVESWGTGSIPADWARFRDDWNAANLGRTIAAFVAFTLAAVGLALRPPLSRAGA